MKKKNIIKLAIVSVLFLLSGLSVLCLNMQVKGQLFVESANDSVKTVLQLDSISKHKNIIVKCGKDLDSTLIADTTKIAVIDSIIKHKACSSDSIKRLIAEKGILDSIVKNTLATKDSIAKCIEKLNKQNSVISQAAQECTAKRHFCINTIILIVITFILVTAFIITFILFSGILNIFKKNKKMEENNNIDLEEPKNLQTNDTIEFVSPKPVLSSKVYPANNSCDCIVEIQSSLEDTKIYYCFNTQMKKIEYTSPIIINRKCLILAIGQCGNEKSQQIEIYVDPTTVLQNELSYSAKKSSNYVGGANTQTEQVIEEKTQNNGIDAVKSETNEMLIKEDNKSSEAGIINDVDSFENRVRKFTGHSNILGISYQGDNHIKATPIVPCQDCHSFTKVNNIWNIAVVSDGAGSKEHSDVGSDAVCAAFAFYLSNMLKTDKRFVNGDIPNERIWDLEFRALLTKFQNELKNHKAFKSYEFGSLAATIVILAYSPKGYLFAHVGDGRAGVKIKGEWKSILTPHKGEEANQTIFSTTIEFIKKPTLMMSGVFVPETKVEQCDIEAFVLMSDGCENGAWATYQKVNLPDGEFKVEDVNQPRPQTLEELMSILDHKESEQKGLVINFITGYNKGFKTEGDDKTILIGKIK